MTYVRLGLPVLLSMSCLGGRCPCATASWREARSAGDRRLGLVRRIHLIESATWRANGFEIKSPMGLNDAARALRGNRRDAERAGRGRPALCHPLQRCGSPESWNQRFFFQGGGGTNGDIGDATRQHRGRHAERALRAAMPSPRRDSGHDNARNKACRSRRRCCVRLRSSVACGLRRDLACKLRCRRGKDGHRGVLRQQARTIVFRRVFQGRPEGSGVRAARSRRVRRDCRRVAGLSHCPAPPRRKRGIRKRSPALIAGRRPAASIDATKLPATFSPAQFARVREAVLEACDADDGARDGITANWTACTWKRVKPKLQARVCTTSADCLSSAQVDVIGRVYSGAVDSKGRALYASWPFDGGIGSDGWRGGR